MDSLVTNRDNKSKIGKNLSKIGYLLLNIAMWLVVMFPLIYAFFIAITPASEMYNPEVFIIPPSPTLENFRDVFDMVPMGTYIKNSMIVSLAIVFTKVTSSIFAGFSFRFLEFKAKRFLFIFILATSMIPMETIIISQYLMVSAWGWIDTLYVLLFPNVVSAFNIFLFVQGLKSFPDEIYESAKIDGASDLSFIFRVLIPLMKPTIGAMAVQSFLIGWNMYMWPLLVTNSDSVRTVQIGLSMLNSVDSQSIVLMIAGVVICIIPSILVFILGQRAMEQGLTSGAVKG